MAIESDRQLTKYWTKMAKLDLQVNFLKISKGLGVIHKIFLNILK